jgi:galactokinase
MGLRLMMVEQLKDEFKQQFGAGASHVFFAPGRVNLIGEYTDFNGGHVFPCALDLGTYALVRARTDNVVRMYSSQFARVGQVTWALDALVFDAAKDWSNYPAGVLAVLQQAGWGLAHGFDVLFWGNLPNGAGLSSSASIEVCTAILAQHVYGLDLSMVQLVQIAQRAENQFIGVNCGIMDQFASGFGRAGHAILLDTNTLKFEHAPVDLGDEFTLLIANTNKRRELAESNYNLRRAECDAALAALQTVTAIGALCDLSVAEFERHAHVIVDENARRRARHAVSENQRTLQAVAALNQRDLLTFGQLMNASHVSLRDDFEVTGLHLDALVHAAWQAGAVGARMTGAGFGGCAVMLVRSAQAAAFQAQVEQAYLSETGLSADFYAVRIGEGARLLEAVL